MSETELLKRKGLQEGPPIKVDSLLTEKEYNELSRKYTTYNPPMHKLKNYEGGTWRTSIITRQEIENHNRALDKLLEKTTDVSE